MPNRRYTFAGLFALLSLLSALPVIAQIEPDETLGNEASLITEDVVVRESTADLVEGGASRGGNLFHSFLEFNVDKGQRVYFANPVGIESILSRVTGNNPSNIFGLLGVDGSADLFLLNPNGIIFGRDAAVDTGGSFFVSTASEIQFGENGIFSTTEPQSPSSILTINPSAFLFSQSNPAAIENRSRASAQFDSFDNFRTFGLRVPDGESLFLVGGDIDIDSGGLVALDGRLDMGGLAEEGAVKLNFTSGTPSLEFPENLSLADVSITNEAGLLVAGNGLGEVIIHAENLLMDSSGIFAGFLRGASNAGDIEDAGSIDLNVSKDIVLKGLGRSAIENDIRNFAVGNGGDINIRAGTLSLQDGAVLSAEVFGQGEGNPGDINITTDGDIQMEGLGDTRSDTLIINRVIGDSVGNGGNVNISSGGSFSMTNGAQISAVTEGLGDSGNVLVDARESISFSNATIFTEVSDGEISGSSGGFGNAGDITIRTKRLSLLEGSQLRLDTENEGNAGDVFILADEFVIITGKGPGSGPNRGSIVSSAISSTVESTAIGKSGTINILTDVLEMEDGAFVRTRSFGQGTAGDVNMQLNRLELSDSDIETNAARLQGGNIRVNAMDDKPTGVIILRENSDITTDSLGNGGNIILNSVVIAFGDSDILARSEDARGGNITFGPFFSETLPTSAVSPIEDDNQVDVSADGLLSSGIITAPDTSFVENGLNELADEFVDTAALIFGSCIASTDDNSSFVVAGTEGLPHQPGTVPLAAYSTDDIQFPTGSTAVLNSDIQEAHGIYQLFDGRLVLSHACKS